jgi:hypothetical protein
MNKEIHKSVNDYNNILDGLNSILIKSLEQSFVNIVNSFPEFYPQSVFIHDGRGRTKINKDHLIKKLDEEKSLLIHEFYGVSYKRVDAFHPFIHSEPFMPNTAEILKGKYPCRYINFIEKSTYSISQLINNLDWVFDNDYPKHTVQSIGKLFVMNNECVQYIKSIFALQSKIEVMRYQCKKSEYEEKLVEAKKIWASVT